MYPLLRWQPASVLPSPLLEHLHLIYALTGMLGSTETAESAPIHVMLIGSEDSPVCGALEAGFSAVGATFQLQRTRPEDMESAAGDPTDLFVMDHVLPPAETARRVDRQAARMTAQGVMVIPGPAPVSPAGMQQLAQAHGIGVCLLAAKLPYPLDVIAGMPPEAPVRRLFDRLCATQGAGLRVRLGDGLMYLADESRSDPALDALRARLRLRDAAAVDMAVRLDAAQQARDAMEPEIDRLTTELEILERRLIDESPDQAELRTQLSLLQGEIRMLQNSTSWKITAPMRWLGRWLGR